MADIEFIRNRMAKAYADGDVELLGALQLDLARAYEAALFRAGAEVAKKYRKTGWEGPITELSPEDVEWIEREASVKLGYGYANYSANSAWATVWEGIRSVE